MRVGRYNFAIRWSIVLWVSVKRQMNREWKHFFISTTCNKQKQGFKWLNGKQIRTHCHPFCMPDQMQICVCTWIYRWTNKLSKIRTGTPGLQAAGPSLAMGHRPRGVVGCGLWAFGPPAAGPSQAMGHGLPGRWAFGPSGHRSLGPLWACF